MFEEIATTVSVILFIVIPLIFLGLAVFLGLKRNIYQSASKLAMSVIAIVLSFVIVRIVAPDLLRGVYFLQETLGASGSATQELSTVLIYLLLPACFLPVFAVISGIFALLYIIPGRLLSNKAFAKRTAKKTEQMPVLDITQNIQSETTEVDESGREEAVEENVLAVPVAPDNKANNRKTWIKVATVACSVVSTFLVLCYLYMPVHYYGDVLPRAGTLLVQQNADESLNGAVNAADKIGNYPLSIIYRPFQNLGTNILTKVTAPSGATSTAKDTLLDLVDVATNLLEQDALTAEKLYSTADILEKNSYLNEISPAIFSEFASDLSVGNTDLTEKLFFQDLKGAEILRAIGNLLKIQSAVDNKNGADVDAVADIIETMDVTGLELLRDINSSGNSGNSESYSIYFDNVLNYVIEARNSKDLSDDELDKYIKEETTAMKLINTMMENPKTINARESIPTLFKSDAFLKTITEETKNGKVKDPFKLASGLPKNFANDAKKVMISEGIQHGSVEYKAFIAFVSIK